MAVIKKIKQKIFNGTDWDTLHAETEASQVITADGGDLETKVGKIGKKVTASNGYDFCVCLGNNLWLGFANVATSNANSDGGCSWSYTIPTEFKVTQTIGKIMAIASNDGLGSTALTTGYVTDSTDPADNTKFSGGCYDMRPDMKTRIKIYYYFYSTL